jgi:hypothetical protein
LRNFSKTEQTNIRHARCRIGEAGTADIHSLKSCAFDEPGRGGVECAGHGNAA